MSEREYKFRMREAYVLTLAGFASMFCSWWLFSGVFCGMFASNLLNDFRRDSRHG